MERSPDLVIIGGGIAGLWTYHALRRLGYDILLLEKESIGNGQTIAAQGILHSGLKFSLAGKVNTLANRISKMPEVWRSSFLGDGPVDLRNAKINSKSQLLLIPSGLMGGITKIVTQKILGNQVHEISPSQWPTELKNSGFIGSVIYMDELVIDVPSTLQTLASPYLDNIRKIETDDPFEFLKTHKIIPKKIILTAAHSNHLIAKQNGHDNGMQTQARPLLQGVIKNAPFPLFAHFIGKTDKPVMTVTTHTTSDGTLVWYLGAGVAERSKSASAEEVFSAAKKALKDYLPAINQDHFEWATLPIDRIEGKSNTDHWMPDTPTLHAIDNVLYAWPTKLTFAPMLSDMILADLHKNNISPSHTTTDFSFLPAVEFANTPWEKAQWTK